MSRIARNLTVVGSVVLLTVALAGVAAWTQRARIAERLIVEAARNAGFETAAAKVSELTPSRIVLDGFTAGSSGASRAVSLSAVAVDFDLREAVWRRRVRRVSIGPCEITAMVAPDGAVSIAGYRPAPGQPAPLPFDQIEFEGLRLRALTGDGPVEIAIDGNLNVQTGGVFNMRMDAAKAGLGDFAVSNLVSAAEVILAPDGGADIVAEASGDAALPAGTISMLRIKAEGRIKSWREALAGNASSLRGGGDVSFSSGAIASSAGDQPPSIGEAAGAARIDISETATIITLSDGGVRFLTGEGARLSVRMRGDAPLYRASAGGTVAQAVLEFADGSVVNAIEIEAASPRAGAWSFSASGKSTIAVGVRSEPNALSYTVDGLLDGSRASGRLRAAGDLGAYGFGDWSIIDGRAGIDADWRADLDRSEAIIGAEPTSCLQILRLSVRATAPTTEIAAPMLRVCPAAGQALARITAASEPRADIALRLDGEVMDVRSGETRFVIDPPTATFSGVVGTTTSILAGALDGGSIAVDGVYELSGLKADFDWRANEGALRFANLSFRDMRPAPMIGRMALTGETRLAAGIAEFAAQASTPRGVRLATISGQHDLARGAGRAEFNLAALSFSAGNVQPADILPALTGVVSNATGGIGGQAKLSWAKNRLDTSGSFDINALAFRGPGVAVSRTAGLNGSIRFESLAPLKTVGEQSIDIGLVDLDALKLEKGRLLFSLDGDERLHVISGEFPWFGGAIGVYDAFAPLDGSTVELLLRAENVNLAETLAFLNIDGLSGEGRVRGELPIVVADGKAEIRNGVLSAIGPGVVRYVGGAAAVGQTSEQAQLAFDILRDLRFSGLSAKINGPLDDDLAFDLLFEGTSEVTVGSGRRSGRVTSPVIYRLNIEAPLLALIEQARVSSDFKLQLERAGATLSPRTEPSD